MERTAAAWVRRVAPYLAAAGVVVGVLVGLRAALVDPVGRELAPPPAAGTTDPACPMRGHETPGGVVQVGTELRRVGPGPDAPAPPDHAFLLAADGRGCQPVRFDPCQPIPYVVNPTRAPSTEAVNDVHAAVARLSEASGLRFVFEGTTDETFLGRPGEVVRPPYQPDRYGDRWAPVLVTWTEGFAAGDPSRVIAGGAQPVVVDGAIVTAVVALNARASLGEQGPIPAGFGPGITWGRVLLHELGHAVGLGHAGEPSQLMYEPLTDHPPVPANYASGDRAGLRLLGRDGGCVAAPAPRPVATSP